MPFVPNWIHGPDVLGAIEAGAATGLRSRSEAASEDESAKRLKLAYDQLSQQEQDRQQELKAHQQDLQAANALRKSQMDAMTSYHLATIAAQQGRADAADALKSKAIDAMTAYHTTANAIANQRAKDAKDIADKKQKDVEAKSDAAQKLKDEQAKDIQDFLTDVSKEGLAKAASHHALALMEPGIRSTASQALLNPKPKTPERVGTITGIPVGTTTAKASLPADSPLINTLMGTNAPAGTGTNYQHAGLLQSSPIPSNKGRKRVKYDAATGDLVPVDDSQPLPTDAN